MSAKPVSPLITWNAPASVAVAPTKSDTDDEVFVSRGLYVGTTGDVKVTMWGGQDVTFANVPAGVVLPVCVTRVWTTGTDAADLLLLY